MPEATNDASILIAISHQAHDRAIAGNELTIISDCTLMIVFAGFFIEANLNQIIKVMNKEPEMLNFLGTLYPGIREKLVWFYNFCAVQQKLDPNKKASKKDKNDLYDELAVKLPGLEEIYKFRNKVSHGNIDSSTANLVDAERLRVQAKSIVDELVAIAEQAGYVIPRTTTYYDAIAQQK